MLHGLVAMRGLIAMGLAAAVGAWGLHAHPVDMADPFLGLIEARSPGVFVALVYGYAALWFTTPFFGGFTRALAVRDRGLSSRSAHSYLDRCRSMSQPESRPAPTLVLGETHFETTSGRAPSPAWLTIPQRGLYTGVMVVGRRRHGENFGVHVPVCRAAASLACRRCRPQDRRPGARSEGRLLQAGARDSEAAGPGADYIEIGLDSAYCYNPLHNDLDPYAVAFAIATLLNNLFGKSKEPFWQQAYTDLLKFVILLRRSPTATPRSRTLSHILEASRSN